VEGESFGMSNALAKTGFWHSVDIYIEDVVVIIVVQDLEDSCHPTGVNFCGRAA
jgi:hypothetical protein